MESIVYQGQKNISNTLFSIGNYHLKVGEVQNMYICMYIFTVIEFEFIIWCSSFYDSELQIQQKSDNSIQFLQIVIRSTFFYCSLAFFRYIGTCLMLLWTISFDLIPWKMKIHNKGKKWIRSQWPANKQHLLFVSTSCFKKVLPDGS